MNLESLPPRNESPPPPRPRSSLQSPARRADVGAMGIALGAATAAAAIPEPLPRFGALLVLSIVLYVMGLFQPRPR